MHAHSFVPVEYFRLDLIATLATPCTKMRRHTADQLRQFPARRYPAATAASSDSKKTWFLSDTRP